MSTHVFPSLIGLEWNVTRDPIWSSQIQDALSGAQTALSFWSYPKWAWKISFSYLPSTATQQDMQTLAGFFNIMQGRFDSFLYQDADDSAIVGQALGTGDGTTLTYQLVRAFGGFIEPILAPHTVSKVYVDGIDQVGHWTVSNWGTATPGLITFAGGHAPTAGKAVTADFSFYFPVRFDSDQISFTNFMSKMWSNSSIKFTSIKLGI